MIAGTGHRSRDRGRPAAPLPTGDSMSFDAMEYRPEEGHTS
jgi:hypothetical protein